MEKLDYWLTVSDDEGIYIQKWNESHRPKAIIQIAHGMAEHIQRYDNFARFLVGQGFAVYGNDHRGHGKTGENQGTMGYFTEHKGFDRVAEDLYEITNHIKQENPGIPIILFGHSMGSFLTRRYIQFHSNEIAGLILSGTGSQPRILTKIGKLIARREIRKRGKTQSSALLNKIALGSNNKKIKNVETKYDWLTRDKEQIQKYIDDQNAGFVPTTTFFYDLFDGLDVIHDSKLISQIQKGLPILFISGDQDPVGKHGVGVEQVINQYRQQGMTQIESIFYEDARHELLNELNKEEVYGDILEWMNRINKL